MDWTELEPPGSDETCEEPEETNGVCLTNAECDDGIDCTDDACVDGRCVSTPNDLNCPADAPFCFGEDAEFFIVEERSECRGCCNPCRSQCALCGPVCPERPVDEFPDFGSARADLIAKAEEWQWNCEGDDWLYAAAGECPDGKRFLRQGDGFFLQTDFYDAETGAFVGNVNSTDCADPICHGRTYWPTPPDCTEGTVTEVLCGPPEALGEVTGLQWELPW